MSADDTIDAIIVANRFGLVAFKAKVFINVTGEVAGMVVVHAITQTRNDVHKIDTVLLRKRLKKEG